MGNDQIDEIDWLKWELAGTRVEALKAQLMTAQVQQEAVKQDLRRRYELGDADTIDPNTRIIMRSKPEPPALDMSGPAVAKRKRGRPAKIKTVEVINAKPDSDLLDVAPPPNGKRVRRAKAMVPVGPEVLSGA